MYAYREKPKFSTPSPLAPQSKPDESWGCGWSLLAIVIAYFVLSAIFRITNGYGSKLDQVICFGALIVFMIIMFWGTRDMYKDSQAAAAERQQWKNNCTSAEVTIVDRHGGTWVDGYENYHTAFWLKLEMNSDQRRISPNHANVSIEVGQGVYERLAERDKVRIYYKPETPLTFLLEEEI